jgi:hypothetical protein
MMRRHCPGVSPDFPALGCVIEDGDATDITGTRCLACDERAVEQLREHVERLEAIIRLHELAQDGAPIGPGARDALLLVELGSDPRLLAIVIERAKDGEFVVAPGRKP